MEDENTIRIGAALLDNLLWKATRYCVGRHSYVSAYARDYWSVIRNNRDKLNEGRLQFYARDIKDNIAQVMGWWKNVTCENTGNDRIVYDPYFLLTRYMYGHPECDFGATDFTVDCISGEVEAKPKALPLTNGEMDFARLPDCDLSEWSKLASCIADTVGVVFEHDGRTEEIEAIERYDIVRYSTDEPWRWERYYTPTDRWQSMIPGAMIKEVKPKTKIES